jgi:hypothetical protein
MTERPPNSRISRPDAVLVVLSFLYGLSNLACLVLAAKGFDHDSLSTLGGFTWCGAGIVFGMVCWQLAQRLFSWSVLLVACVALLGVTIVSFLAWASAGSIA